jgi:hypothetical protein
MNLQIAGFKDVSFTENGKCCISDVLGKERKVV